MNKLTFKSETVESSRHMPKKEAGISPEELGEAFGSYFLERPDLFRPDMSLAELRVILLEDEADRQQKNLLSRAISEFARYNGDIDCLSDFLKVDFYRRPPRKGIGPAIKSVLRGLIRGINDAQEINRNSTKQED